jgi:hypothetical protein
MSELSILTPKGYGKVDRIFLSELGFFMLKISFENGTFTTYNLGKHNIDDNIFTNELMIYEEKEN